MPLYFFYTMVQKSKKWPKTQIKGGSCLKYFFCSLQWVEKFTAEMIPSTARLLSFDIARCSWQVQCACTIARLSPCSLWPFSFSLKSVDAKMASQQHSVYFFSSPGLLEHDFMKKTAREKIWSARVSRLECRSTRSLRPADRGRPQCPVSYSASHLLIRYTAPISSHGSTLSF